MQLFRIALLLSGAVSLPRLFNSFKWKHIRTIGNRGPGMSTTSIRSYFNKQRGRQKSKRRINQILNAYFTLRDSQ